MCRWLAYVGEPTFLDDYVTAPEHSLVAQALHAEEAASTTQGDGFGLGWYGERDLPGLYREVRPAWSDDNLLNLCRQVRAHLFFAHVRAATEGAVARANCHPFVNGRIMFMHNGQIGGFTKVRRQIEALINDDYYEDRAGATDSEALFLALLSQGLLPDPVKAMARLLDQVARLMQLAGLKEPLRFTSALSDGETLYAFRWATDDLAPSLYWREDAGGVLVASEPVDLAREQWREVPKGCVLTARSGDPCRIHCLTEAMRAAA